MQRTCWAFALLAAFGLIGPAVAGELVHPQGAPCTTCKQSQTLAASACGGPAFGTTVGCCEQPPTACDNAWAGYCQEKQRWKAFWYRIGTGSWRGRCVSNTVTCHSATKSADMPAGPSAKASPPAPLPAPTIEPPAPEPADDKAAYRIGPLWRR